MKHPLISIFIIVGFVAFSQIEAYAQSAESDVSVGDVKGMDEANLLIDIAWEYYNSRHYDVAIDNASQALEIIEREVGSENPEYARALSDLAQFHTSAGNYSEAIRLGSDALSIQERLLGKDHPDYLRTLYNFAYAHTEMGSFEEGIRLCKGAMALQEKAIGKDNPAFLQMLLSLASVYSKIGDYAEAIRLATEALGIGARLSGKESPDYTLSLENLAVYYSEIGDQSSAIRLGEEAMEIIERNFGKNSLDYAIVLGVLASSHSKAGDYLKAAHYGYEVVQSLANTIGTKNHQYASALNSQAVYASRLGNVEESIYFGTEALKLREELLGKDHPDYAVSLGNHAVYYMNQGDLDSALRLGAEAVDAKRRIYGKEHPEYALSLRNQSIYLLAADKSQSAIDGFTEYTDIAQKIVIDAFKGLPSGERAALWGKYADWFLQDLPYYNYHFEDGSLAEVALDGVLFAKGLLLNAEIELSDLIDANSNEEMRRKVSTLRDLAAEIETLAMLPIAERYCDVDSLREARSCLEFDIMSQSKAYGDYTANLSIGWRDVQQRLRKGDIAIEFISYPIENDSTVYSAFIIEPSAKLPHHVVLFSQDDLDKFRSTAVNDSKYILCPELADLIWGGLKKYIRKAKRVFFSPAGELYNLPIEVILSSSDCKARLYRLSSTRQLAVRREPSSSINSAIYGGVDYGSNLAARISPLPGTLREAVAIDSILTRAGMSPHIFTSNNATEASFKALDSNLISLIHIGTHGFYWSETDAMMRPDHFRFLSLGEDGGKRIDEDKALTRSGLLLAGAADTFSGIDVPLDTDDGVLTAKEISELDLRGLDLVVLSSCRSGLGDITGEGVFGLQRGFKKAGANSILMSLWEVDDEATRLLMTRFYENLFIRKMSKFDSLNDARAYLQSLPYYSSPRYWAAFILLDAPAS